MYRTIDDFISDYRIESGNTLKILHHIDPAKKHLKINDNIRSMERLSWHIIQAASEMMFRSGLQESDDLEWKPIPDKLGDIENTYQHLTEKLLSMVKSRWTDSVLAEKIEMFGESWSKGSLLRSLITHEIHHRAQMTVVMRYFGSLVPGLYGPAREEWANYKMPAME
ncbi:MAG TPA: DinB family protein [Cyclobacteriaceae bacterium]|nr:DinB family protein [Cyclobacteriaceae bacterium]